MKLFLIYNANSGVFNSITDIAHKTLAPTSYHCNLCKLTHGVLFEKKKWINFISDLNIEMEYLHKDFLPDEIKEQNLSYPVILIKQNEIISELITSNEIDKILTLDQLIKLVENALLLKSDSDQ